MKWNIITHNIRGFNDPESIAKQRGFLSAFSPKVDTIMIQEYKLWERSLENLANRLMLDYNNWILEAALRERSWLNSSAAGNRVEILITNKFAKLVTVTGALYDTRVVWVKLKRVEWGNLEFVCIYAFDIITNRRHLWYILIYALFINCEWIIEGDFNMTERP